MATAPAGKTSKDTRSYGTSSSTLCKGCTRCGGLMVGEFSMDLLNGTEEVDVRALRCVLCGEVVDPVILQNRMRQQEAARPAESSLSGAAVGRSVAA